MNVEEMTNAAVSAFRAGDITPHFRVHSYKEDIFVIHSRGIAISIKEGSFFKMRLLELTDDYHENAYLIPVCRAFQRGFKNSETPSGKQVFKILFYGRDKMISVMNTNLLNNPNVLCPQEVQ